MIKGSTAHLKDLDAKLVRLGGALEAADSHTYPIMKKRIATLTVERIEWFGSGDLK